MNIIDFLKNKLTIIGVLCLLSIMGHAQRYAAALSPTESRETFQLNADFDIEPFITEPDVLSPVDIAFDARGNIYVVEMGDYPYDAKPGNYKGRIRMLRDTDGDGKVDKSFVFAEDLPSATSVLPWEGGILVTAAPDILYLKDTDGDSKADEREVIFTGFFDKNSEAQVTNLRFGPDNWIYANNHGQRGLVSYKRKPETPAIDVSGGNFRFRLDRDLFQSESGVGQFGLAVDDWGHRFYSQNTLHIQQAPIAWRYAHRHEYLPSYRVDVNISDHEREMFQKSPTPHWREVRSARRQANYDSLGLDRKEYARDYFSGASGGTFYGGDGFPESYYGAVFTGDVSGNLVHRDVLSSDPDQPAFVASRDDREKEQEFLTSTDPWFRPANFYTGPDGYLYLVDMYRQHIETPVSIPEDLKEDMDFANGEQYGRIWRIFPKNGPKREVVLPNLAEKESAELVTLLTHPNQWWRLTAHRLLLERQDNSILPLLNKTLNESTMAQARLLALYSIEGQNALAADHVKKALSDVEPGVREHALMLAEKYPQFLPEIIKLTDDASPQVAYQASLSLGQFSSQEVLPVLARIAEKKAEDNFYRMAVLSSKPGASAEMLETMADGGTFFKNASPGKMKLIEEFAYITGSRNGKNEIKALLEVLLANEESWQTAGLNGLANGIKRSQHKGETDKATVKALQKLEKGASVAVKKAIEDVRQALAI
ncbi:PVC-type heme-binding CxxCH protein [Persicitalea sp.]|uniref:PVC-type heme-binding CxxCH protein n=1 Tax=Persicitalea sp. TaxID=3100273 RepID=UPI003593511A